MLAAGCTRGSIAELGTVAGIGSAWIASAMPADCTLVTAEIDPARAKAAAAVLAGDPRVRVLTGDWTGLLAPLGPFDLIFCDSGVRETATFGGLVGLLKPGGRIVMDDVTPVLALPADLRSGRRIGSASSSQQNPGWCGPRSCWPIWRTPCSSEPAPPDAEFRGVGPGQIPM